METCEICYEKSPPHNFKDLICGHKFCLVCLRSYLEIKIWTETVCKNEIICLRPSCRTPINIYTVKEILRPNLWNKYENLWKNKIKLEVEGESQMSERAKCVRIYEDLFEHLIFKMGWKRCPNCNCVIEKIGRACNYLYCESKTCQKKTVFCYTCGKKIKNPKTHFKNNKCLNKKEEPSNFEDETTEEYNKNYENSNIIAYINDRNKKDVLNADEETTEELNKVQTINDKLKFAEENEKINQIKQKRDVNEEETTETSIPVNKKWNEEKKWDGYGKFKENENLKIEEKDEEQKNERKINIKTHKDQLDLKKSRKNSHLWDEIQKKQDKYKKNEKIKKKQLCLDCRLI